MVRILIAVDDPAARDRLLSLLTEAPDVTVVDALPVGEEAVRAAQQHEIDLVLLGPARVSRKVLPEYRVWFEPVPIVLLIDASREHGERVARAGGMAAWLYPAAPDTDVLELIARIAAGERPLLDSPRKDQPPPPPFGNLTDLELWVLRLVRDGKSDAGIGEVIGIDAQAVTDAIATAVGRLNVIDRAEAVALAGDLGWLDPPEAGSVSPAVRPIPKELSLLARPEHTFDPSRVLVVVVARSPQVCERIAGHLRHEPSLVVVGYAAAAPEALDLCQQHEPDVLLVGPDISVKTRVEVVRSVRRRYPRVAVVQLAERCTDEDALAAFEAGVAAYCDEFPDPANLALIVKRCGHGENLLGESHVTRTALAREAQEQVRNRLGKSGQLPLTDLEALVLQMRLNGQSLDEIADRLGLSRGLVLSANHRAFRKLKDSNGPDDGLSGAGARLRPPGPWSPIGSLSAAAELPPSERPTGS